MTLPMTKKRLHPRIIALLPAEVRERADGPWNEAVLYDLSLGGAAVLTAFPLDLQREVRLRFALAKGGGDSLPVEIAALVVRAGAPSRAHAGFRNLSGLHFLPLSATTYDRLRTYVWEHLDGAAP